MSRGEFSLSLAETSATKQRLLRAWYNGYHVCFPSMKRGFDSLRPHQFPFASSPTPQPPFPMKNIRLLLALAVASLVTAALVNAEEAKKEAAHPAGTEAKCCMKADKNHEKCTHECCVATGKEGKNCEKCGGTNEAKK